MGRILAVDWGGRRLGLARSDALGLTAQPLPPVVLPAATGRDPGESALRTRRAALEAILAAAGEHEVERVVVGLPLELSGRAGESALEVEELVAALRERLPAGVGVETWDERFTSALAARSLREEGRTSGRRSGGGRERARARPEDKARVDQRAALLLLQSWLDAHPTGGAGDAGGRA